MRVLMVCSTYPPTGPLRCGIGDYTRRLVTRLAEKDCELDVITGQGYTGEMVCQEDQVRIFSNVEKWDVSSAHRLLQFASREKYALLHWQYHPRLYGDGLGFTCLGWMSRTLVREVPVVVTVHTFRDGRWDSLPRSLLACHGPRKLVFTNEPDLVRATKWPLIRESQSTLCPVGPTIEPVEGRAGLPDLKRELNLPEDSFVVSTFGFINRGKGFETLLRAVALARRDIPHLVLLVAGQIRPQSREQFSSLKELSSELGIESAIRWLGEASSRRVSGIIASSHVYAAPYEDGASCRRTTLMTGLAHGVPVLTTTPSDNSLHLRPGVHAEWVLPGDHEEMAARLVELWQSPAKRSQLAQGALEASQQFSWEHIAEKTLEIYQEVGRRR